jgi:hypothetical protein
MKKSIFLISLLLCNHAFAKDVCKTVWKIESLGVPVGISTDVFTRNNNTIEITSSYIPSGIAATFNVKQVNRIVRFQDKALIFRQEEVIGKGKDIVSWSKDIEGNWQKMINDTPSDHTVFQNQYITLDSTSLPYLFQLGVLINKPSQQGVNVVTKYTPYQGKVTIDTIADDPIKKSKIYFKTEKNNGTIYFNSDSQPLEMSFSDPKMSFKGYMIENNCGKQL